LIQIITRLAHPRAAKPNPAKTEVRAS
jgi:hypothetical protein